MSGLGPGKTVSSLSGACLAKIRRTVSFALSRVLVCAGSGVLRRNIRGSGPRMRTFDREIRLGALGPWRRDSRTGIGRDPRGASSRGSGIGK
ncbi:hypothetical protein R1sor_002689 [Riccia sorocarpa]|uniref:Uncharacterized protein n=1 Tax=Riccia sorocarpa TaxID=122646 RepID=A0ABD3H2L5_9MARC